MQARTEMSEEQTKRLKRIYDLYDTDGSGTIQRSELAFLRAIMTPPSTLES